ncbi:hypothetical protein HK105_208531 [Polyrhizophydium stewartii]|uniref:Uncharacterized protein n=1 Tax=Polyrhizophydium stewartii TaxID=2732419 RepID=A0ABR4MXK0_9FUNG
MSAWAPWRTARPWTVGTAPRRAPNIARPWRPTPHAARTLSAAASPPPQPAQRNVFTSVLSQTSHFFSLMVMLRKPIIEISLWVSCIPLLWELRGIRRDMAEHQLDHQARLKLLVAERDQLRNAVRLARQRVRPASVAPAVTVAPAAAPNLSAITGEEKPMYGIY